MSITTSKGELTSAPAQSVAARAATWTRAIAGLTLVGVGLVLAALPAAAQVPKPAVEGPVMKFGQLSVTPTPDSPEGAVFSWNGPIAAPMADNIRQAFEKVRNEKKVIILYLVSPGGAVVEGERVIEVLATIKKTHRLATLTGNGELCASMCVPIYLQGQVRFAGPATSFMFHEPRMIDPNTKVQYNRSRDVWLRLVKSYFPTAGVAQPWTSDMVEKTDAATYWQTGSQLWQSQSGVVTCLRGDVEEDATPPVVGNKVSYVERGPKTPFCAPRPGAVEAAPAAPVTVPAATPLTVRLDAPTPVAAPARTPAITVARPVASPADAIPATNPVTVPARQTPQVAATVAAPTAAPAPTVATPTGSSRLTVTAGTTPGTLVFTWAGRITSPMAQDLKRAFDDSKSSGHRIVLRLDADGGSLSETQAVIASLDDMRKTHRVDTYVSDGATCAGLCTVVFLQGRQRFASPNSTWVFRALTKLDPATGQAVPVDHAGWQRMVDTYYPAAGVARAWTTDMKRATATRSLTLTGHDVRGAATGMITDIIGPARPAANAARFAPTPGAKG